MEKENCSSVPEFIFLGISSNLEVKVTLFAMLLLVYYINLLGNLRMIILIRIDPQLQTRVFFFLSYLSLCNVCYSTGIGFKMLVDLLAKNKPIPFYGCALQFLIACTFADSECLLLAVMPMTGTRLLAPACFMRSACPAGCAPCSGLRFT